MIEQLVEKKVIDAIEDAELASAQIFGVWQASSAGVVKGLSSGAYDSFVSVKTSPRTYATFTIREAEIGVAVTFSRRSETDADGSAFLEDVDKLTEPLFAWQSDFEEFAEAFEIEGFTPTGFRLDGGDCGFDAASNIWTYTQNFTIQGIIN